MACFPFIVLLFNCRIESFAQNSLQYYNLTVDNGLPSNNVYYLLRDKSGFLWGATDNGVFKYDGYKFRVFDTRDGLPSNDIWNLFEDADGRIWLFSNTYEIGYISTNKYCAIPVSKNYSNIFMIGLTSFRHLTVALFNQRNFNYLAFVYGKKVYSFPIPYNNALPFGRIRTPILSKDHYLWLFYYNNTVFKINLLNPMGPESKVYSTPKDLYPIIARSNALYARGDYFYSYSYKGSILNVFNIRTGKITLLDLKKKSGGSILKGYFQNQDFLVIKEKNFQSISGDSPGKEKETFLPTDAQITSVCTFGANDWYSTSGAGIWVRSTSSTIRSEAQIKDNSDSFQFISANKDTTYWWNESSKTIRMRYKDAWIKGYLFNSGIPKQVITNKKQVYVLANTGIFRYGENDRKCSSLFSKKALLLRNFFMYGPDSKDEIFYDSLAQSYLKGATGIFPVFYDTYLVLSHISTNLFKERVRYFETFKLFKERADGVFTLFGGSIICIYNLKNVFIYSNDFQKHILLNSRILTQLGIDNIRQVVQDSMGKVYVLTDSRLYEYTPGSILRQLETGLNLTTCKLLFSHGRLIIYGDFGLAFYADRDHKHLNVVTNYLKTSYRKIIRAIPIDETHVLLETDKHTYEIKLTTNKDLSTPYYNNTNTIRFKLAERSKSLRKHDTIVLTPEINSLEITPFNMSGTGIPLLSYRMKGDKWGQASSSEIPVYNLEREKWYTIEYFARDDFWESSVHTLALKKLPFWYQSRVWQITFLITGIVLFATVIILIVTITRRMYFKANEKRRLQTELELRAIHAQINPHFIFNTLSTALYFISKQHTKDAYEHVSKFSKLLRNYLRSSRERFITLADETEMLRQYIELQRARFSKAFQYEITVQPDILPNHVLLPSLLLQPLVENAINHGIFNKGEHGFLKVHFYKGEHENELICIIDDNGIGRAKAKAINKKYKKEKHSYGTALTRELIDIFKRYEQMDIDLEYIDKEEPQTGTTVKLTIRNVKIANL